MARKEIIIGAVPNDGTGDALRDAMEKSNDNSFELYNRGGWGIYSDGLTTTPTQVIGITPQLISIDGLGSTSNSDYLPREIRGTGELWDTVNNKIIPIGMGDSHSMRLDLEIITESANPEELDFGLDIGGGASPSIVIVQKLISLGKSTPYQISISFPFFTLSSFLANGGQLFVATNTGTVTIAKRSIMVTRISSGSI